MIPKKETPDLSQVTTEDVKSFWQQNPLCISGIPYEVGLKEFFEFYNRLREEIEPIPESYKLHEYLEFKGKKVLDVGCEWVRALEVCS